MLLVGLTGGIGSGKSTVSALWATRGAAIVDADLISREILEPGGRAYQAVIDRFGQTIVASDGKIIRPALAGIAFGDAEALAALNSLTHPAIADVMEERVGAAFADHRIVVVDVALLHVIPTDRLPLDAVVVVDVPEDVAVQRLIAHRSFTEADARARIAAQASREERRGGADLVIDNSGDIEDLEAEAEKAWQWLEERETAA
jgi:dephospho-CoA kinase